MGSTPCKTAPRILKTSPRSQTTMKMSERPSAEWRRKFSIIWGEKTTTQQAIDIDLGEGKLAAGVFLKNLGDTLPTDTA